MKFTTKTAFALLNEEFKYKLSWGEEGLDEILSPITLGLTEIVGESGVGKTQLMLQLALQAQESFQDGGLNGPVALIITEGNIPTHRLKEILLLKKKKW